MFPTLLSFIAAVLASFIVGIIWYSPVLFGTVWAKLKKFDSKKMKKAQKELGMSYMLSTVGTIIQTIVLYQILFAFQANSVMDAVSISFSLWLGFIAVTQLTMMIFSKDQLNLQLFVIDTMYQLASLLCIGVLLTILN